MFLCLSDKIHFYHLKELRMQLCYKIFREALLIRLTLECWLLTPSLVQLILTCLSLILLLLCKQEDYDVMFCRFHAFIVDLCNLIRHMFIMY